MRFRGVILTAGLLLAATQPVAAQEQPQPAPQDGEIADIGQFMQDMFAAEPLSPEAQARLPQAGEVVAKVMPDGFYARMMRETLAGFMEPMAALLPDAMPADRLAIALGVAEARIEALGEEDRAEITAIIDPAFGDRMTFVTDYVLEQVGGLMSQFEPGMRDGLTRAYASRFSARELADIAAFFATETGARYATESMMVFTDPQTIAGMMEAIPAMMQAMPDIVGGLDRAMANAPPPPDGATLSDADRARIAQLLDMPVAELESAMASAGGNASDDPDRSAM